MANLENTHFLIPNSSILPLHESPILKDYAEVNAWISTFDEDSETRRAYLKEARRFLRWLEYTGLTIQQLEKEDASDYLQFIASPPEEWLILGAGEESKDSGYFRLLQPGGLSAKSVNYTNTVIRQLLNWLREDGYIAKNVFKLIRFSSATSMTTQERYLDLSAWQWLWREILKLEDSAETAGQRRKASRTRWIFALLYHTGMRCSEAAKTLMGSFVLKNNTLQLAVTGKGNKKRLITVNSELKKELIRYRRANPSFFATDFPSPSETSPVIRSVQNQRSKTVATKNKTNTQQVNTEPGITSRQLSNLLRSTVDTLVTRCHDQSIKAQVERMTVHWMRHTNGTHRIIAGSSLLTVQDELGHADPKTTRIYAKTTDDQRRLDAEKLASLFSDEI